MKMDWMPGKDGMGVELVPWMGKTLTGEKKIKANNAAKNNICLSHIAKGRDCRQNYGISDGVKGP